LDEAGTCGVVALRCFVAPASTLAPFQAGVPVRLRQAYRSVVHDAHQPFHFVGAGNRDNCRCSLESIHGFAVCSLKVVRDFSASARLRRLVVLQDIEDGSPCFVAVIEKACEGRSTLIANAVPDLNFFLRFYLPACSPPLDCGASQRTE
jgi:hypothetical protein